ncbi:MAG: hypothetical protein R2839_00055 [Thermomicrobiales bacterium]
MSTRQLIGVDIGTTGVKAALIDNTGALLADHTVAHDLHFANCRLARISRLDRRDW